MKISTSDAELDLPDAVVELSFAELAERVFAGEFPELLDELPDEEPQRTDRHVENLARRSRALAAEQDQLFRTVLDEAADSPDAWVGPDPTDDPSWSDPRGRTIGAVRRERRDFAVRAPAADLATRVRLSETTIRSRAHRAAVLSTRLPLTWRGYLAGDASEQNATTAASLADSLPADEPHTWTAFDAAVSAAATTSTPARFRTRARAARERVHAESLETRHTRAAADRDVWVAPELDGMGSVTALLPAVQVKAIERALDTRARELQHAPGETRSLAELRADIFADLLTGGDDNINATVFITIPALTLLGHDDQPATLDGYGPIDLDTAQRLAGGSKDWVRVLTDPITSSTIDVDRRSRRIPKRLRRWLAVRRGTRIFPGCGRSAHDCDIDHRQRVEHGGATDRHNLDPLCESHHRIKDETLWRLARDPATDDPVWTSPTGITTRADPPPF